MVVAYWFTSSTSFANPAVTIARTLSDTFAGIAPSSAPMFVLMQLVGAGAAYAFITYLYPTVRSSWHSPETNLMSERLVRQWHRPTMIEMPRAPSTATARYCG